MTQYRQNAPALVKQIQIHQNFLMLQMHMQMLQAKVGIPPGGNPAETQPRSPGLPSGAEPSSPGVIMQQGGIGIG